MAGEENGHRVYLPSSNGSLLRVWRRASTRCVSFFACSVLLNEEVLYCGHALDQGYFQGVHISNQSRDLVNAFWWCRYLDHHLSFQILTSQVIKFVLKQTAEWAILSQGCLRPLCWSTNVWAVLQQMCIKQSWILKWTFNYACWGFFNVV